MKWKELPFDGPEYDESQDTLIRQSTINQFKLCPGRVGFADKPGHLAMVSEPLAFGTCVHHLIAEDLTHQSQQDDLLLSMNEWVEDILVADYDWSLQKVPHPRDFFSEITVAYRLWREKVLPTIPLDEVVEMEQEHFMYLGPGAKGNIFLKGTADLVMDDLLVDWKTAGRAWKPSKAQFATQASLYMPLHKQALGLPIQEFWFWVFDRQYQVWTRIKTERTIAQIDAALVTALEYGRQLEAEVFPCTPTTEAYFKEDRGWYCKPKFCGAWNICDAKFLNDGFNEKEIATRSW